MCAVPSCTTCATAAASRPESRKSWPTATSPQLPSNPAPSKQAAAALCSWRLFSFMPVNPAPAYVPLSKLPNFDPRAVPVIGIDTHLPAVGAEALVPQALRERFRAPPSWEPEVWADPKFAERQPARAAVLVPVVMRERPTVLLTERTTHLSTHSGQVAFPGGKRD